MSFRWNIILLATLFPVGKRREASRSFARKRVGKRPGRITVGKGQAKRIIVWAQINLPGRTLRNDCVI